MRAPTSRGPARSVAVSRLAMSPRKPSSPRHKGFTVLPDKNRLTQGDMMKKAHNLVSCFSAFDVGDATTWPSTGFTINFERLTNSIRSFALRLFLHTESLLFNAYSLTRWVGAWLFQPRWCTGLYLAKWWPEFALGPQGASSGGHNCMDRLPVRLGMGI